MTVTEPRAAQECPTARWTGLPAPEPGLRTRVGAVVARRLFTGAVDRLPVTVHLHEPYGIRTTGRGGPVMDVLRPEELFARLGRDANIGFGEAYLTGAWEAEDLAGFLTVLARALEELVPRPLHGLRGLVMPRIGRHHRGDPADTQRDIAHHYDLSNELFALFLDPSLTYSSAWFRTDADGLPIEGDELEPAQERKIDALLDLAGVGPGTRLLEIGTGWGTLAIRAARRGADVVTVTLSEEQALLARQRVAAAGLSERVDVQLRDYRDVTGTYDAVVSVEMVEAVGWRYWPSYLSTIDRVLAPGGRVAIQSITMAHHRMLATRDTDTWITRYVFPGGFLPSVRALAEAARDHTSLRLRSGTSLGLHYAETLRQWDEAFTANSAEVEALGFDADFRRMWHFYLEYCRAGFAAGYIDDQQLLFTREGA
ncbi:MAG: cyclopropane-fatty-acyl-phospholipid synthase family protein [Nocardioidaceae bacterium]|nr:cyclopropane-fatty-acyl-phospholipid synthase family protein [Nocardioidaceae bacterium]MCL2615015.1 cyclopropane-fatty-acyl-phospholipid synthase family protein [Nocardioidaceae bacterium]